MDYEKFGQNLKRLMKENGVMGIELGPAIGVNQSTISRFCKGKVKPSLETAIAIADYFHVSLDFLLGREQASSDLIDKFNHASVKNKELVMLILSQSEEDR